MKNFEETMRTALIDAYISEYGEHAWLSKSEEEKFQALHELLCSFLTVAKRKAVGA